jgi:mannose-6-phosphate isomerase-like protein (cupin superfamily)
LYRGPRVPEPWITTVQAAIRRLAEHPEYWFDEGCHIVEVSNHDDDPLVSIARARVPPGGTTRWHVLHGIAERYLVVSGHGRVEVGELGAREIGPGDVVLIPAGVRQRVACVGEADLVFFAVCTPRFRVEAYEDVDRDTPA